MKLTRLLFIAVCCLLVHCQKKFNLAPNRENAAALGKKPPGNPPPTGTISYWLTKGDQSVLLQEQSALAFGAASNRNPDISIDATQVFQTVDGFGYTLTTGSAYVINRMPAAAKNSLLQELFGSSSNAIGVSYLRVNVGASDLSPTVYSYDDLPAGQTDPNLQQFSLQPDAAHMIPVLQQILAINPNIKIFASPWSAPVWMKNNNSTVGGQLLPAYYNSYANYLVKYLQGMKVNGITIDAITPQNEPLNPYNNLSMYMPASQQDSLIRLYLGPALQAANLNTKIILYDHNCDQANYPLSILANPTTRNYVDGSAFHLYAGTIDALTTVHNAYPNKNVYFTEQYTAASGNFGNDLKWHLKNVITGAMRNWSKNALEWNLANDENYGPHTAGGCDVCKGAVTINSGTSAVTRNVAWYIIGHASKFVPAGSIRIASTQPANLYNVAFKRPDGKKVLIVENDSHSKQNFNLFEGGQRAACSLDAGAVATYIW